MSSIRPPLPPVASGTGPTKPLPPKAPPAPMGKTQPGMRPVAAPKPGFVRPAPVTSSMGLPNRAGEKGPVPVRGIVNGLVRRSG